jgi:hypothetical protein
MQQIEDKWSRASGFGGCQTLLTGMGFYGFSQQTFSSDGDGEKLLCRWRQSVSMCSRSGPSTRSTACGIKICPALCVYFVNILIRVCRCMLCGEARQVFPLRTRPDVASQTCSTRRFCPGYASFSSPLESFDESAN